MVENTCRDIRMVARATLNAKGASSPARRTLPERRLDALLSSCPPTSQKFLEQTRLRMAIRELWKERWTKQTTQERRNKPVAQGASWNPKIRQLYSKLTKL